MRDKVLNFLNSRYTVILEAKQKGTISWREISEKFEQETGHKINKDYFRSVFSSLMLLQGDKSIKNTPTVDTEKPFILNSGKEDIDKGTKEFVFTADKIPTQAEIIEHFNIDTVNFRINQIYHKTSFGGKYAITVSLLANKGNRTLDLDTSFIEKLNNIDSLSNLEYRNNHNYSSTKACLFIGKQDSHWNKWDMNGNNSIEERFATFTKAMITQLEKVNLTNNLEKIFYIVGSDEFNSEWTGTTTKGTPQKDILTYQEAFEKISLFSIEFIKLLRFYTQKIEVVLLNGNHDFNVSWHLANLLKHVFSNQPSVKVDTELINTKILEYGSNLILVNHGDEMKPQDLATKFPIIAREKWSQFENHFVISGDKHHEKALDVNGVRTYQLPQLSNAKSYWDDKKGHLCSKAELVTFLFEENELSNILRKVIK